MGRPQNIDLTASQAGDEARKNPAGLEDFELIVNNNCKGDVLTHPLRIRRADGNVYLKTGWAKTQFLDDYKYALVFVSKDRKSLVLYMSRNKPLEKDGFEFKFGVPGTMAFSSKRIGELLSKGLADSKGWDWFKVNYIDKDAIYEGLPCVKVMFDWDYLQAVNKYNRHNKPKK